MELKYGSVSKSILEKAGKSIQDELKARHGHQYIADGNFVTSGGANLKCKKIYHACLSKWGHDYGKNKISHKREANDRSFVSRMKTLLACQRVELHSLVLRCLEEASQHNVHSIAFPALGTGALGYPKDVVAETMYDAVRMSQKTLPTSSIKKVLFVVFHKDHDTVHAFRKEEKKDKKKLSPPGRPSGDGACGGQGALSAVDQYHINSISLEVRVGDILSEICDCIVVTVNSTLDLTSGTVSKQLINLKTICTLPETRRKFNTERMVLLPSNESCNAMTVILMERNFIRKDQKAAIKKCLILASRKDNYTLSLPIFAPDIRHMKTMARDLHKVLRTLTPEEKGTLKHITVVVYDSKLLPDFLRTLKEEDSTASHDEATARHNHPVSLPHQHSVSSSDEVQAREDSTRVRYTVATQNESSSNQALDILQRLSKNSANVVEVIQDDRLRSIEPEMERQIEGFSSEFEVNVKVEKLKGCVKVRGKSFEVCQVLKKVLAILSDEVEQGEVGMDYHNAGSSTSEESSNRYSGGFEASSYWSSSSIVKTDTGPSNREDSFNWHSGKSSVKPGDSYSHKSGSVHQTTATSATESTGATPKTGSVHQTTEEPLFLSKESRPKTGPGQEGAYAEPNNDDAELFGNGMDTNPASGLVSKENKQELGKDTEEDYVEWFFLDIGQEMELISYESISKKIESAYLRGDSEFELPVDGAKFNIDFTAMVEYAEGNKDDKVFLIRREKLKEVSQGDHSAKIAMLQQSSPKFKDILELFTKESGLPETSVLKIEEMKNDQLDKQFSLKKKEVGKPEQITKRLWHGPFTSSDTIVNVNKFGFNKSYCSTDKDLGEGVIFYYNNSHIIDQSKATPRGHHHICLAKVLVGISTVGQPGLRSAPKGHLSVVDELSNPSKLVVFFDNQAVPEFLVTFTIPE